MVTTNEVLNRINRRLNRLLTIAQAALPAEQFKAFRKATLDEFGHNGLAQELKELERNGQFRD